jgi:4-nitrophenyl phosphatase
VLKASRLLEGVRAFIVDLDGVVWLEGSPIWANVNALRRLAGCGYKVVFLTNNSARSRRVYSLALSKLGLRVSPGDVVTSGYSASVWVRENLGSSRVYIVGEEGLVEEFLVEGHVVLDASSSHMAEAVVVGLDRNLSYQKLEAALRALNRGALFVATNRDHVFPGRDGPKPGAGAIVSLLETASGRRVDFDAGKHGEWILRMAMRAAGGVNPEEAAVVGDRVDTDVEMALRAGSVPVLVLTGLTGEGEASRVAERGVVVVEDLGELGLC